MRILFLGLNYAPEEIGIGLYSGDMCRWWAAHGIEVRAIVGVPYYPAWQVADGYSASRWRRSEEAGVDVTRCPIYVPARPSGARRIAHYVSFFLSAALPMLGAGLRRRPDVVFTVAPSLIAAPLAWLVARLTGARCWLHVQDFEVEAMLATGLISQGPLARLANWFERRVLRSFDTVSTISPNMCRKLVEKGVAAARVVELRNWADIEGVSPLSEPSPYAREWHLDGRHVALYSGNIANKQGIEIVLQVARLLQHREDLVFVVCGQGPNLANLKQAAADLANIRFHDLQPRERLGELLGLASVHLMPQIAGAADLVLPSKLTNMLASGRPIVATASPGTGLAAETEGAGLCVEPGDAPAFAQAVERLLDDSELARTLGETARRKALENWSKPAILGRAARRLEALSGS